MARPSESELLVLHGLRLKSMATPEVLAELVGLPVPVVRDHLEAFQAKEWVRYREGVLTGWMLLAAGRAEGQARVAAELADAGADAAAQVDGCYRQFLALNRPMLQVCTDWQLRPVDGVPTSNRGVAADEPVATTSADAGVVIPVTGDPLLTRSPDPVTEPVLNDHTDAAYDQNVIGVLRGINAEVQPVCASLAEGFVRFSGYGLRLSTALSKVELGEHDWFTKPVIDSYHTVWFELHEDLLATLGIERGSEEGA